ncbi:MAG: relaxase/mobilization nuclease domain-containing protein [Bacteroidota bacterium]
MISKPVPANSFYHTCRYIAQKQGAEVLLSEGVRTHDFKLMAADFEMQKRLRPAKKMACFHSILSFYPGEKPSDATMREIANKYLQELGIVNTQYAVSKHTDKAHLHMHIVANMVNNDGKAITDSWIGLRGKKIAQKLTLEYNLIQALEKNLKLTNLESLSQLEANKYKIYITIAENLPQCRTMEELEKRLLKHGIAMQYKYKGQTQERQGVSFKIGNLCFKESQVDRNFSYAGLTKTLELQQKQILIQQKKPDKITVVNLKNEKKSSVISKDHLEKNTGENNRRLHDELTKNLTKTIDNLLNPDNQSDPMPYELTQKEELRKKRKRSQRHNL